MPGVKAKFKNRASARFLNFVFFLFNESVTSMPEASLPPFLSPIPGFHMATRAKFGLESLGLRLRLGYAYLLTYFKLQLLGTEVI